MSTLCFGTSIAPCKVSSVGQPVEADEKRNCDPDRLLQCPFDKNHQIRACRFPYHLIKCRKNHPKLASELKTCPYNARHLVPKDELMSHTETCEDRSTAVEEVPEGTNGHFQWQVPVSTWVNPNMLEDWDQEADDNAALFVWGGNDTLNEKPEVRPTNNLGQSSRTPRVLPW